MIMKWEDLEVGDQITTTKEVNKAFDSSNWTKTILTVSSVHIRKNSIEIGCNSGYYYFEIMENGCHRNYNHLGPFFEIVKLKDE